MGKFFTPRHIYLGFLTALTLATLWFAGGAIQKTTRYLLLGASTSPSEITWSVEQKGSDHFAVRGDYTFELDGISYTGVAFPSELAFRNKQGAEWAAAAARLEEWPIWYTARKPSRSSLERFFPTKACIYAGLLLCILLYFLALGWYIRRNLEAGA